MSSGPASGLTGMETERVTASTTIEAAPEAVFAVLAAPSAHADIDGTGWVRESLDDDRITAAGQVFRHQAWRVGVGAPGARVTRARRERRPGQPLESRPSTSPPRRIHR